MELTERIAALLDEKFTSDELFTDCFTVEIELKPVAKLNVFIDSDSGMDFGKCQKISRYLESHIDEKGWLGEKYTLEVSSPGIGRPLKFLRQYVKNIGRTVEVTLLDNSKKTGPLKAADAQKLTLEQEIVELEGKKKVKKIVDLEIPMEQVSKTVVKITF